MKTLTLNKFGAVLTGREFGKDSLEKIDVESPVTVDFSGVIALGSSYADEVLVPIARRQNNTITVSNANSPVQDCIKEVAKDGGFEVEFID